MIDENFTKIINNDNVIKAYITPDNKFLKIENKNGTVYTIWAKYDGYQMSSPINPNLVTGSSTYVLGQGEWDFADIETVMNKIIEGKRRFPHFFTNKDIEATEFLTIEQAVAIHGNILQFNKIK